MGNGGIIMDMMNDCNYIKYFNELKKDENSQNYLIIYQLLETIARTCYEYDNLTDFESRHIEKALYYYGNCLLFEYNNTFYALPCKLDMSNIDVYNDPQSYSVLTPTHHIFNDIPKSESVLIRNNILQQPTKQIVRHYANRLANLMTTLDINVNTLKTPFIARGNKKQILSLERKYKKITGNELLVAESDAMKDESLTVNDNTTAFVGDKIVELYDDIFRKLLTHLGINNNFYEKKERMITSEIETTLEVVQMIGLTFEQERRKAIEDFNKMFGQNVELIVNYATDDNDEVKDYENI